MADELNVNDIANQIGNEIFGGGDSTSLSDGPSSGDNAPNSSSAPQDNAPPPEQSSPPTQYTPKPLPKSWKKEMEAHWGKLPKEIHDYVYDREADVMRGIQMYKESSERWGKLVQPYEPLLREQPQVDPVQLLQTLMNNHLAIVRGTPEQKKALAQQLIRSYGIELGQADGGNQAPSNQELMALRQEINALKQGWTQAQEAQFNVEVADQKKKIEAFAADPKNKYFEEVGWDIHRLLENKVADTLESAYEQACWLNPGVRAKMLAEQSTQFKPQEKTTPTNINGTGEGTPSRRKQPATIDETIAGVIAKHYPTH